MNINRRFYVELFEKKSVNIHSSNYKNLYNKIWLCEQKFKDFLNASDSSLKLCYAKKIYTYIHVFNDVAIPDNFVNNIIYYQQHELVDNTDGYVPQDHVIHSINLYILGVYLFFNFPLFHKKLTGIPRTDKDLNQRILSFIKKWRNFSLYHDIGYSIETAVDKDGMIKSGIQIPNLQVYENMIYLYTIRNFSRLIIDVSLIEKKGIEFNINNFIDSCIFKWKKNDTESINISEIKQALSDFNNTVLLYTVSSDYGFNNILSLLNGEQYLVIINDELENPLGILLKQGKKICTHYLKKNFKLEKIKINPQKYTFQYIIKKGANYLDAFRDNNPSRIMGFYDNLPQKYKYYFEFISDDQQINNLIFQIFEWFCSKTDNSISGNFEEKYKANLTRCYKNAIKNCIYQNIDTNSFGEITNKDKISSLLTDIFNKMQNKKNIEEMVNKICNDAISDYLNDNGVYYDFIYFCTDIHKNMFKLIYDDKINNIDFIKINDNHIDMKLFSHCVDQLFEKDLYNKILQKSELLGINFNDLCSYKTIYSSCDHGLISAGLFYQATVFSNYLAQLCKSNPSILLAWDVEDSNNLFNSETIDEYADIIFAILLHNIYTRKSNSDYGINYTQKIEVNAFSYFCAFCDNLQKWKRPKQIEISKTNIPEHHFLNDDFDLLVENDHITIVCNNYDVESIHKDIKILETFLDGVSNIIQIKGI